MTAKYTFFEVPPGGRMPACNDTRTNHVTEFNDRVLCCEGGEWKELRPVPERKIILDLTDEEAHHTFNGLSTELWRMSTSDDAYWLNYVKVLQRVRNRLWDITDAKHA